MFEKFLSVHAADFRQRYEGTFGFYTVDGKRKFLALLESIDLDRHVVYFRDEKGVSYSVNADASRDIGFEFLPPASAFYNTEKGIFFMERVASRQFKRGVSSANMKAFLIKDNGFNQASISFPSLVPVYEQEVPLLRVAKDFKENKTYVMAISPNFLLCPVGLYVFKELIGNYNYKNKLTLSPKGNQFATEVKDALRSCGLTDIEVCTNEKT
jgi:hypothetical protein